MKRIGSIGFFLMVVLLSLVLGACADRVNSIVTREAATVTLIVDGQTRQIITTASNVREVLEESNITLNDADLVDPPLFTPISGNPQISIIRVTESIELIEQTIPFQRRTVRNESMSVGDPPLIIQSGNAGIREIAVRIVFHDGLEFSRQETKDTIVAAPQDEIVMIGVGATPGSVNFTGSLAFISSGNSVLLRGSSAFTEQINTGGDLDHRVFTLSPGGSHLLYTRTSTDTEQFNTLWVVGTEPDATPRPLEVNNVLWADWNPDRTGQQQIAFTTAIRTELLPGWEANNDLWIGDLPSDEKTPLRPRQIVEAYPATYGWWGGNYAWSPQGQYIAYAYADEIGLIDTEAKDDDQRTQLQSFTEYNTRSDWVWVPSLSWSPDGNFLAYSRHDGGDSDATIFDTWVVNVESGVASRFVEQSGIWSHPWWSPGLAEVSREDSTASQIAYLRASNPRESQRSSYTLWLMDRDGSNRRQLYPPAGENSRFPREQRFMAWGPGGRELAFIYDESLYLLNLDTGEARRITQGDGQVSNPTWAPYGGAVGETQQPVILPTPVEVPEVDGSGNIPTE